MELTTATISAAIGDLSEYLINDAGLDPTNADAMAGAAVEAERLIADQLVRHGYSLTEAEKIALAAGQRAAKSTSESSALMQDAFRNRGAPLPATVAAPAAGQDDGSDQNDIGMTPVGVLDQPVGAPAPSGTGNAVPGLQSTPVATQATYAAPPAVTNVERAQRLRQKIMYTVEWKPVRDIFRRIPADDHFFDFELPVFNWAEAHPAIPALDPNYAFDRDALLAALYAIVKKKSVAFVGPHGCGKTKLTEQVAARLNMPVTVIPMDGQMSRGHLFGQEKIRATATGSESYYQYGILPMALEEPGIILFDEFDRADETIQYACHSVYEGTFLKLLEHDGRQIPLHPENRIFGTANTKGRGSDDGMYGVGNEMSEATRDRWSLWVDMDYQDEEEDLAVLKKKIRGVDAVHLKVIATLAHQIRQAFKDQRLSQTCSMRQQLEAGEMLAHMIEITGAAPNECPVCVGAAIERVIIGRANAADAQAIRLLLEAICPEAFPNSGS